MNGKRTIRENEEPSYRTEWYRSERIEMINGVLFATCYIVDRQKVCNTKTTAI